VCENTFSTVKQVKSKNRNRTADETLDQGISTCGQWPTSGPRKNF